MKAEQMVRDMFLNRLKKSDLASLARSRGFTAQQMAARELLEHVFLSGAGVEDALASLSGEEVLLLHALNALGEAVEIDFFQGIYGKEYSEGDVWVSSTERDKGILRRVQAGLVQKGVLVVSEERGLLLRRSVLADRLRFLFPQEFDRFLPPPFAPRRIERDAARDHRGEFLRQKIREVLEPAGDPGGRGGSAPRLWIQDGELLLGEKPFSAARLLQWQGAEWEAACLTPGKKKMKPRYQLSPAGLVRYALSRLGDDEAAAPEDLVPLWSVALPDFKLPDAGSLCEAGWRTGCLERISMASKSLYRLPRSEAAASGPAPVECLDARDPDAVGVDVEKVSPQALELLAGLGRLVVRSDHLRLLPCFSKLSQASEEVRRHPFVLWMGTHHAGFRRLVETADRRRNRTFVHENLTIARIRDLSLKVQIEKKLAGGGRIVALSEEFIAFPQESLKDVLPLVKKAGHVVKVVEEDDHGDA